MNATSMEHRTGDEGGGLGLPATSGHVRPTTAPIVKSSSLHFDVNPQLPEVRALARTRGWIDQGFTVLTITWQELHWTADAWKTVHRLSSTDVPCPVTNGHFALAGVAPGTAVEFALHVGVACHAPQDAAGARDEADVWFNNEGRNYEQHTR
ncbi:MAG: hypothetical protein SFW67_12415 [Myxococcaceae bacterium]|nr:hypothetical protein [Myxococcaceae bacterium]